MSTLQIDPGEFRTELSLQECQTVYDALGGYSENWVETAVLFAKIEPLDAASNFAADQTTETVTHRVYVRWQPGLASGMRFALGERVLEVVTVHDPDETGRYLMCMATEKGA
ncbi:MAG: phage head closure protein [Rhizobiaceae bacterium]|nr:phage head closure protein [Rhizobiaceae bacterium]